jgi:hypothetical protein
MTSFFGVKLLKCHFEKKNNLKKYPQIQHHLKKKKEEEEEQWFKARWPPLNHRSSSLVSSTPKNYF